MQKKFINFFTFLCCLGKLWAVEKVEENYRSFNNGFSVKTKIDRKSTDLEDKLKEFGLFDGSGPLNFSEVFSMNNECELNWPIKEPTTEDFTAQKMFGILRNSADISNRAIASSFVAVLKSTVSIHWFTGSKFKK